MVSSIQMASKILDTGVNGYVEKHLTSFLPMRGFEIVSIENQLLLDGKLNGTVRTHYGSDLTSESGVLTIDLGDVGAIINITEFASRNDTDTVWASGYIKKM